MDWTGRCSVLLVAAALLSAGSAVAGPTDGAKCYSDKLKRAGLHSKCRMLAESKLAKTEGVCSVTAFGCYSDGECPGNIVLPGSETCDKDPTRYNGFLSKCDTKLSDKFAKAETKWGAECPTTGDAGDIQAQVTGDTDDLVTVLSGGPLPPECGDGTIEAGEDCDFGDLDGETCTSQLGVEAVGALACTAGACTFDTTGCQARYEEQNVGGEPTVVDHATGLEWVVTNDSGSGLLDKDNVYTWSAFVNDADGTAFTVYIAGLNGGAYGGHTDWRLPSSRGRFGLGPFEPAELESILLAPYPCGTNPCIDQGLFGPTAPFDYWSSSTVAGSPTEAWNVNFSSSGGGVPDFAKASTNFVRAVRGGL